ncbi:MAG: DUF424 family protein [Ignisphaera sp.]
MEGMYYVKIHHINNNSIVAICDEEILGKVFKEGDIILDVSPNFYKGERVDFETVLRIIEEGEIVVVTGRRIIKKLSQLGLVNEDYALKVEDQLHIQIIREVYRD